jgi:PTH1 family peptidyl-tRNA hydrolase
VALLARGLLGGVFVFLDTPRGLNPPRAGPIAAVSQYYRVALADVVVVCDDVNLPIGRLRARATGSEGGHNGLRSIADTFGTVDYARIRVGIGRGDTRRDMADYVLARFDDEERPEVDAAIARTADAVETWAREGLAVVMNTFNRADVGRAEGKPGHDTKTNGHD